MKETTVFICGILLTIIPFLGVPHNWRQYAVLGIGILLILVGYALRRSLFLRRLERGNGERGTDSFVETSEQFSDEHALE